MHCCRVYPW